MVAENSVYGRLLQKIFGQDLLDVKVQKHLFRYNNTLSKRFDKFVFTATKVGGDTGVIEVIAKPIELERDVTIELSGSGNVIHATVLDARYGKFYLTIRPEQLPVALYFDPSLEYLNDLLRLVYGDNTYIEELRIGLKQILQTLEKGERLIHRVDLLQTKQPDGLVVPMPFVMFVHGVHRGTIDEAFDDELLKNKVGELFRYRVVIAVVSLYEAGVTLSELRSDDVATLRIAQENLIKYFSIAASGDYAVLKSSAPFVFVSDWYAVPADT